MFKTADPNRRIPTYLQANTKENVVWQLKLLPVVLLGVIAYEWWDERRFTKPSRKLKSLVKD